MTQLDKFYLKGKPQLAYQTYDNFEKLKMPTKMPIADNIVEFERIYNKAKAYDRIVLDILAYKFLKACVCFFFSIDSSSKTVKNIFHFV